jgi:pimeloyl-ACP methyl ester carboxylesterase
MAGTGCDRAARAATLTIAKEKYDSEGSSLMQSITHRNIATNGTHIHIAEQGEGTPVIMIHGFPGLWYSWRYQMPALAAAGYRAVAVDQRGYGRSDRPVQPELYDMNYMMDDMLGVLDALGERQAIFVGHDFGAPLVWNLAVRHPDRVKAVVALACPYDFDLAGRGGGGNQPATAGGAEGAFASAHVRPSELFAAAARQHFFHMHYFQEIGPAERELGPQVRPFLTKLFWALCADGNLLDWRNYPSAGTGYLDVLAEPAVPPPWPWMSDADLDYYIAEYERGGPATAFIGGLNGYRMADRNWELGEPRADANVEKPALFISGAEDPVLKMVPPDALDIMRRRVPDLRDAVIVPRAGHFVQQEQPEAVNTALLKFLATL